MIDEKLADASHVIGLSERQLRRQFLQVFGSEPSYYLTTRRLLFAKQLLQDTTLPIYHVAYAAGFGTPGRLTIQMRHHYGFTPSELRRRRVAADRARPLRLRADYRPPLNWQALLSFLAGRATPDEWIENDTYYRLVDGYEITVTHVADKHHLLVTIPTELSRQSHAILQRVRSLFDLDANPTIIEEALSHDALLAPLIQANPGMRVPGCWDSFEMLLRVIIGQQVSVVGATTIMRRFAEKIGTTIDQVASSSPETIAGIGMPGKHAYTIWNIAQEVKSGALNLGERDPERFYAQLVSMPGIGPWTAEYLRMRVLRWPDAFPAGDLGLQKALTPGQRCSEKQLLQHAEAWRPWRSYATMLLWKSLENQGG